MALNNYIEDDWDDNALTDRSASQKDVFYQFSDGGTGDLLKGVYRPKWEIQLGNPTINNGEVIVNNIDDDSIDRIATPSNIISGSWEIDMKHGDDKFPEIFIMGTSDFASYYGWQGDISGVASRFLKDEVDTQTEIITGSDLSDNIYHRLRFTRNSYGEFEYFEDGVSQGTSIESFVPDVQLMAISQSGKPSGFGTGTGGESKWDNLVIQ